MHKVVCVECGCICRMTQKWLDECGSPTCACGSAMYPEGDVPETKLLEESEELEIAGV